MAGQTTLPTAVFNVNQNNYSTCREYPSMLLVYPYMPLVTLFLVALNVAVYGLELAEGGLPFCERFGLVPTHLELSSLVSYAFLHDPGTLVHIGCNLAFLAVFGAVVEAAIGGRWFLALYAIAAVAGGLMHIAVGPGSSEPLVGASGAIFGVLAVAAALRPRLLGFAVAFAGVEVWHALAGGSGGVSFGCHLGGFVAGVGFAAVLRVAGSDAFEAA